MNQTIANKLLAVRPPGVPAGSHEADYPAIFEQTQRYIVEEKIAELRSSLFGEKSDKEVLRQLIAHYLKRDLHLADDAGRLTERIYNDMTGFGFLDPYFAMQEEIEEININSWESIEVRYANGLRTLLPEHFHSPAHAREVLLRILHLTDKHLDDNKLIEVSHIGPNVRIAAVVAPVADKSAGIAASIRFIHAKSHPVRELIGDGMLSGEGFDLLRALILHGVSICFCGGTGAGKTTLAGALLGELPDETRVITIEAGTREFDLIRRGEDGRILTHAVHLQTRPHRESALNIDLQTLLDLILKFHPELVVVGEMVSEEAFIAQETARTGHTVLTTIHTNNAYDAYYRMFTLGIRKYRLDESILLKFMVDAFPIIVYVKQYADKRRRVQSILEGTWVDGKIHYNELYAFQVEENRTDPSGKLLQIRGSFQKVHPISDLLKARLLTNGMPAEQIDRL